MSDSNGKGRSWKERGIDMLYMGAVLMLLSGLHTVIVLPQTLDKTRAIAREEMELRMNLHERQVDERMSVLYSRLDALATKEGLRAVEGRLEGIEERLRHLERSGK